MNTASDPRNWFLVLIPIPDRTISYIIPYKDELMQNVKEIVRSRGLTRFNISRIRTLFDKRCNSYLSVIVLTRGVTAFNHKYLDISLDFEDIAKRFDNTTQPFSGKKRRGSWNSPKETSG